MAHIGIGLGLGLRLGIGIGLVVGLGLGLGRRPDSSGNLLTWHKMEFSRF